MTSPDTLTEYEGDGLVGTESLRYKPSGGGSDPIPETALKASLRVARNEGGTVLRKPSLRHGTVLTLRFLVGERIRDLAATVRWDRDPNDGHDHVDGETTVERFGDLLVVEAEDARIETLLNSRLLRRVRVRRERFDALLAAFNGKPVDPWVVEETH